MRFIDSQGILKASTTNIVQTSAESDTVFLTENISDNCYVLAKTLAYLYQKRASFEFYKEEVTFLETSRFRN